MAAGFKQATVNASKVPSTQTNFPTYVDLSRLGITTLAEAQSVRVYSDSAKTTELAREIVSATEMHVKIPSLTSTFVLYVDWDGVSSDYAATDTYGRHNVWTDYVLVLHLDEVSGNAIDSSPNDYSLTDNNTVGSGVGKIGGARDFERANVEYFSLADNANISLGASDMTWSFWAKYESVGDFLSNIWWKGWDNSTISQREWSINCYTGGSPDPVRIEVYDTGFKSANTSVTITTNWQHHVARRSGTTVNFTTDLTFGSNTTVGSLKDGSQPMQIGAGISAVNPFDGLLDEMRMRRSAVSNNWITTEYNNQSDEATFWGTWTDVSVGTTFVPKVMMF